MKLLKLIIFISAFISSVAGFTQECSAPVDLLVVGDSQSGATWSRSYLGDFLQQCLKGNFVMYGRGGTVPANWIGKGGMDKVETIQRDPQTEHLSIGNLDKVPECKKRILPMLKSHLPQKLLLQFGGNYTAVANEIIATQIEELMQNVEKGGVTPQRCFFLTPTYEMEVATHRNVPLRDLKNVKRITQVITENLKGRCQLIDSVELMKDSEFFDGKELLKRVKIEGRSGCLGLAVNDNVHVCGAAAKDWAERVCSIMNNP